MTETTVTETTPSGHPIQEGNQALTGEWSMTLPFRMARRMEDESLVFWAPGGFLTLWLGVWGGRDGQVMNREERLADIESRRSHRADEVKIDRSGPIWWHSYRLREEGEDDDGRAAAFYGSANGRRGHVQFAAYFDDEATVAHAEKTFRSLTEGAATNLSKP